MKIILLVFLFVSVLIDGLNKAARVNRAVRQAETLYRTEHYGEAAKVYHFLQDTLRVKDEELLLNLAHATYQSGNVSQAQKYYAQLAKKPDAALQSTAFNQLGLIYFQKGNPERALYHFKKALIRNNLNETARYNYELVQKYLAQNPAPAPTKRNRRQPEEKQNTDNTSAAGSATEGNTGQTNDQTRTDVTNKGQKGSNGNNAGGGSNPATANPQPNGSGINQNTPSGANGNTKGLSDNEQAPGNFNPNTKAGTEAVGEQERQMQTLRARLRTTDLSPEKAAMLLEALHQAELQYLQQVPKKASRSKTSGPDW